MLNAILIFITTISSLMGFFTKQAFAQEQCEGVTYLMSIAEKKELYKVTYIDGESKANLELIAKLDDGGHLAALPGSQMIYTVRGDLLSKFNLDTKELTTVGNIRTSKGTVVNGMVQMGFAPDGTLYGSSSKLDRIYKIDLLTAAAIDLGQIKSPAGSELEYLDIAGGDLVFKQDGTLFIFGRAGGDSSERSIYVVKEGTSGLYAEFFSGPFISSTGMAILNGGRGNFVVSLYKKGLAIVDAQSGKLLEEVELILDNQSFLPGWGDMSNACVEINPTPKYTGSIFFKENDCPVISDRLGDVTNEFLFQEKNGEDILKNALNSAGVSFFSSNEKALQTGSSFFEVDENGNIYNQDTNIETSDQLQIQRFYTPDTVELKMEFLGPENHKSGNQFGVYYYEKGGPTVINMGEDSRVKFQKLIAQNTDKINQIVEFKIPANHYFGFYLTKNIYNFTNYYYSENRFNSDVGFVQSFDQQRPDSLTDHFTFFNSKQGMILTAEDSSLIEGDYFLGEQNYSDLMMGFFSCKDSRLIDPVNNIVDTGTPSDSADAGLESIGQLSRGYALRDVLPLNKVQTHAQKKQSLGLTQLSSSITGIQAKTSPTSAFYQHALPELNLTSNDAYSNQLLKDLLATLPPKQNSWLGTAEDRTPFDIPFVSNAHAAVGVTYVKNNIDQAGLFVTATEDKVYNHSKGICDRTKKSSVSAIQQISIDKGLFYTSKIEKKNEQLIDYAVLFSVFIDQDNNALVDSQWLADDYTVPNNTTHIFNYQVWSKNLTQTRNIAWNIIKNLKSQYNLQYLNTKNHAPNVFVSRANFKGKSIELEIQNTSSHSIDVNIKNPYFRIMQGEQKSSNPVIMKTIPAGLSKIEIVYEKPIFDSLLYIQAVESSWRDSIYIQNGSFTFVLDQHLDGKSSAQLTHKCQITNKAHKLDTMYHETTFNGCAYLNGSIDKKASIYRTTKKLAIKANDVMTFDFQSNNDLSLCLHFINNQPSRCLTLPGKKEPQKFRKKLSTFMTDKDLNQNLPRLKAVEISSKVKGDASFGIENLKVMKLESTLELLNFSKLESVSSITDLVKQMNIGALNIWSWDNDQWTYWSNDSNIETYSTLFNNQNNTLQNIEAGKAYWVMSSKETIRKLKTLSTSTTKDVPQTKGWHLVGRRDIKNVSKKTQNIWLWSFNRLLQTDITYQPQINKEGMWIHNKD